MHFPTRRKLSRPPRMQKFSQAHIASLLYLATIFAFFQQGLIDPAAFLVGASLLTFFLLLFFLLFRFQLNARFYDRSMAFAQITASIITMLGVAYLDRTAQLVLGPFMLIAFSFGTFRLGPHSLAALATASMVAYLGMILYRNYQEGFGADFKLDLLQWVVMALTLPLMTPAGQRIHQLRTALKLTRRQLQHFEEKAVRDELTGLYNRRQLQVELDHAIASASTEEVPFCVCLIDIDHFKDVNDRHGHLVGDVILREFSRVAIDSIRDSDVIGRFGGDEFMHILPNTGLKGAVMHAERLRVHAHFMDLQGVMPQKSISLSIGVAQFRPGEAVQGLIERADAALYRAKERGRNRVEWIDLET